MLYDNKDEFLGQIEDYTQMLALDVGTKTIGIAISDKTMTLASPIETIKRKKFTSDLEHLKKLIDENKASGLIVGLPLNMDGSENTSSQSIRQFVRNVLKEIDIPIIFWDERFSTVAVERSLLEADMSREKRAKVVDKMAAAYILQGFLDSLERNR